MGNISQNLESIHFESKIWQVPLYGSFVILAYLKDFNYFAIKYVLAGVPHYRYDTNITITK
jgi:hypothetical protein